MEELTKGIYKVMGERIWLTRTSRHFSREHLAEQADITPKFLYEIETGRKGFTVFVLCKLCVALDVTSTWIIYGVDQSKENML